MPTLAETNTDLRVSDVANSMIRDTELLSHAVLARELASLALAHECIDVVLRLTLDELEPVPDPAQQRSGCVADQARHDDEIVRVHRDPPTSWRAPRHTDP